MRNGFFPIFTKGRVLKKESIEYLRDFPYDLATLAWDDYSDGVLGGFKVSIKEDCIVVGQGALKYKGNIILVNETVSILSEYGRLMYIKVAIGKYQETEDFKLCPIEIKIDKSKPLHDNEIELGRFCLESGAQLRCKYDSFYDLRTEENTLDLTRTPYAGRGTPTLHPRVLKEFAQALLTSSQDATDTAFALICLNTDVVSKSSIEWYLAKRNHIEYKKYGLEQLYDKLAEMLPGKKTKAERPRGRWPSIT